MTTLANLTAKETQVVLNDFRPVSVQTYANLADFKSANGHIFDDSSIVVTKITDKIDTTRVSVYKITSPDGDVLAYVPTL